MSSVLKSLALFLTIVLIVGNVFLWLFVMPKIDKQNQEKNTALNTQNELDNAVAQNPRQIANVENEETNSIAPFGNTGSTNTVEVLKQPSLLFKNGADAYFVKYNTYGSVAMSLGSCGASSTVFSDTMVKSALSEMTGLTKNIPQCSLATDDTVKKNRMTQYLVYVPMDKGGYCIDNTGAAIVVTKKPTTISCVSGL